MKNEKHIKLINEKTQVYTKKIVFIIYPNLYEKSIIIKLSIKYITF